MTNINDLRKRELRTENGILWHRISILEERVFELENVIWEAREGMALGDPKHAHTWLLFVKHLKKQVAPFGNDEAAS